MYFHYSDVTPEVELAEDERERCLRRESPGEADSNRSVRLWAFWAALSA
jgi:hypothetical protein